MQQMGLEFPRIIIAALRGGSGKTVLSVGIINAWKNLGKTVAPFKKGPDYIDAGWLSLAAGRPCYNLDSFLLKAEDNLQSFLSHSLNSDFAVIEGNRGLYDGIDREGSTSTAELAKLLKSPVLLCVDCTKITRTMAAMISGCLQFDPDVMIAGVILNRVAGVRHENKLRDSIEHYCGIPVLGAIPKLDEKYFPERHLGLVPTLEHGWASESISAIAEIAVRHLNLDTIAKIARGAPKLQPVKQSRQSKIPLQISSSRNGRLAPRIGIVRDSAFQFYYPENIEALASAGGEVLFVSPLTDQTLPELDALYIGGGFPETHAQQLAENTNFSRKLKSLADNGLPVYAECGGLMYLGDELVLDGKPYSMAGIFPLVFDFYKRPQGHGYTVAKVVAENPYYEIGMEIKGHEFHYSRVSKWKGSEKDLVFNMKRGVGISKDKDGILYKNVFATYTHVHAVGTPEWAQALVHNAILYKHSKSVS
ncbi:MAG: cobyrinate a,c-diamide synthase [Deltaproteobacteria bacterium]|nr:MAG: cobyrinate a,c-diamide synthase [Deltaproteobacteria bacterium]